MKRILTSLIMATLFITQTFAQVAEILMVDEEPPTTIIVEKLNGLKLSCAIDKLGKLSFVRDSVFLVDINGVIIGAESQRQTHKIAFVGNKTTDIVATSATENIQVYPNPTSNYLVVTGVEPATIIRIYTIDGQLLQTATASEQEITLPVSQFPQGQYLLQVKTDIFKIIKHD